MNKIALSAAALLVATGSAFAGSDHYGSDNVNQPAVTQSVTPQSGDNIDRSITGSIRKFEQRDLKITPDQNQRESGQGIWGR
ncbi:MULTISPECIES: DUF680 domain-containing protein [unclassified Mesorhizobium]|uniref:DUF680 domain-containing protein n=1 Tax=unclassified Mesorhizobium TaxID=325217 RepID=UPI000FCAC4DF|nr:MULTISPECIES: DUF680 domain-containing protein [unclassified Mesorhizobium]RUW31251.1 DUF680 domain-containing protein [Mesorhizobium sp. M1E.F.Ca.ET.041.01.1.1]RWD79206.1 MAG: DUF680 domain-containing protein [Mesorhizobium sp.]RWD81426.1 MAG: DUF680 domain-containing protein [Mesorhizobium sp.]TIV49094.1 MAG: DUF680 domain-containing protein [Mesorhizobium sp.]